jgi:hypothetical protein
VKPGVAGVLLGPAVIPLLGARLEELRRVHQVGAAGSASPGHLQGMTAGHHGGKGCRLCSNVAVCAFLPAQLADS